MGRTLALDVAAWAAILSGESGERLGAAALPDEIPARHRRRLPAFTRNVLCCALPLLSAAPDCTVVYAAEHGDLESTVALLRDLARGEVLSPAQFALSVHNAPAGALSLCVSPAGDHTAIAGGKHSFAAGMTEAFIRLDQDGVDQVLLVLAEEQMPDVYARFDPGGPGGFLALMLRRAGANEADSVDVALGRAGVVAAARALERGATRIRLASLVPEARAA